LISTTCFLLSKVFLSFYRSAKHWLLLEGFGDPGGLAAGASYHSGKSYLFLENIPSDVEQQATESETGPTH
jgi:hypothetical protein